MEFFKELSQLLSGTKKVTIIAQSVGDQITVGFFPEFASKDINEKVKMCSITGTPEEMDQGFFAEIRKPIEAVVNGLKSNADDVTKELEEAVKEENEEDEEKATAKASAKKSAPAKKAEVKKPAPTSKKPEAPTSNKKRPLTQQNDFDQFIKKGNELMEAKDWKAAQPFFEKALKLSGKLPVGQHEIALNALSKIESEIDREAEEIKINASLEEHLNVEEVKPIEPEEPETIIELDNETHEVTSEEIHQEYVEAAEAIGTTPEEASPVDKQTAFDELMSEGAELMKSKDYKTAQSKYELAMELVESNPKNYDAAARKYREATMWVKARERMNS